MPPEIKLLRNPRIDKKSIFMTFNKYLQGVPEEPIFTYGMESIGLNFEDLGIQNLVGFASGETLPIKESSETIRVIRLSIPSNVILHPTLYPIIKVILENSLETISYHEPVWFTNKLGSIAEASQINSKSQN